MDLKVPRRASLLRGFDEDDARAEWRTVPRRSRRRAHRGPSVPSDLGLFVDALAWIVDSTNADNPHYPMPTREAIGPRCQALLAHHPALAEALSRGGIEAVFLLGALGREEWAVLVAESHELSDRQIAQVLGKKLGTVKATLHAARRKLLAFELGAAPPARVAA